jgi:anaerobic selenocysteine-containing dehydrogenase
MNEMIDKILSHRLTRRQFLKTSAATAAAVTVSNKLLPSHGSTLVNVASAAPKTEVKHGFCHSCHFGKCNILYTVTDGVLTSVEGDPDGPWNKGMMCVRGNAVGMHVYNPYRVKTPMKRTNPQRVLMLIPSGLKSLGTKR